MTRTGAGDAAKRRDIIAVNGRFLTQRVTGVERYAVGALSHLPSDVADRVRILHPSGEVYAVRELVESTYEPGPPVAGLRGHLWEQTVLPVRARRMSPALLLGLANSAPVLAARQVVTVHDVAPLLHPEFFDSRYVMLAKVSLSAVKHRTRRVITVSERSREDLVNVLGYPRERIDVVPPGVTVESGDDRTDQVVEGRYCLFVGAHDPRKNVEFLLRLWGRVHAESGLRLAVTYRSSSRAHSRLRQDEQRGVVWLPDPSDRVLARLYEHAQCLLWPSFYEGFGLPLLEAMAHGTPFASTDSGAARELALDEDQILPLEDDAWLSWLGALPDDGPDEESRRQLRERAKAYSWRRTGQLLAASLRRALA